MLSVKKILLAFFLILFLPSNIFAVDSTPSATPTPTSTPQNYDNISLSEIFPKGSEWIELYNDNDFEINLDGWLLRDTTATNKKELSGNIAPKSYKAFDVSFLNDTGDTAKLYYGESNQKDSYQYNSSEDGKSWSKVNGSWCNTNPTKNSSNSSCIVEATPTPVPTSTPTPTPTSEPEQNITDIRINEIYPCPKNDGNEWIEIYNNHDFEINLDGWYLKDSADNTRKISGLTIASKSFIYFAFGSGFLNNDGDVIRLFDNKNQEKFKLPEAYPLISEDMSWAYVNGNWCSAESTKGSPNTKCFKDEETIENEKIVEKEKEDSKNMLLAKERDLPEVEKNERQATVAGESKIAIPEKIKPNLTIPIAIAGAGFLILSGASYPFVKPKLASFFAKFKKKKKD